jgi:hypothetical protein
MPLLGILGCHHQNGRILIDYSLFCDPTSSILRFVTNHKPHIHTYTHTHIHTYTHTQNDIRIIARKRSLPQRSVRRTVNISKKHNIFAMSTADSKTKYLGTGKESWFLSMHKNSYSVSIACKVMFKIRICILVRI